LVIKFEYKIVTPNSGEETVTTENITRYMEVDHEFAEKTILEKKYDLMYYKDTINTMKTTNWNRRKNMEDYAPTFSFSCKHHDRLRHQDYCSLEYIFPFNDDNLKKPIVEVDKRIVNKIRMNKKTKTWEGMVQEPLRPSIGRIETLTEEWVAKNLSDVMIKQLRQQATTSNRFVRIPPGNPRENPTVPFHLKGINSPEMKYSQGSKRTCSSDSLANALYYLDYPHMAEKIHSIGEHIDHVQGETADIFTTCRDFMIEKTSKKSKNFFQCFKISSYALNDLLTRPSEHIRLVRLLGKYDGDETHAVAIVDKWVFDSSLEEALPLCKKSS
jgi:hypothetical protein